MEIVLADSAAQIDALDFLNVVISGTTNYFIHRNLIQYMIEVETIQEILDRKSFLDSYDIVDYMLMLQYSFERLYDDSDRALAD